MTDMISRADAIAAITQADKDCRGAEGARDNIRAIPAASVADPAQIRADALREAAKKATSFLVGDPLNGVPLRNPMAHEVADAILAMIPTPPAVSDDVAALEAEIARLTDLCDCDCDNDDCLRCAHYPTILEQKSAAIAKLKGGA